MNWLYEKKMKEGEKLRPAGHQGPVPGAGGEPDAWNTMEQGSFSKGFSYSGLDTDTSAQGSGGMTMPGAFSFLGGAAGSSGQDAVGTGRPEPSLKKSKKEEMFDKQMEAYQRDRNAGVPQTARR